MINSARPRDNARPRHVVRVGTALSRLCPPYNSSHFEPLFPDAVIGIERRRRALEYDAAVAHHIEPLRNLQRDRQLLLDQQDRNASARDLAEQLTDLLDQFWRQS